MLNEETQFYHTPPLVQSDNYSIFFCDSFLKTEQQLVNLINIAILLVLVLHM